MLSSVATALLLSLMLLIIASLIISALRERQRHLPAPATQAQIPPHPLDRHVKVILHMQDGIVVDVEKPIPPPVLTLPPSWYRRHRVLISLSFLLMLLLMLCSQGGLVGETLQGLGITLLGTSQTADVQTASHTTRYNNASQRLVRLYQLDPNQYDSPEQYNTWAYSACSTASMAEVFNAYGYHFHISDVLKVEAQIGAITPQLGLMDQSDIARTAVLFGFNTNWGTSWTLDQVIDTANTGKPVIVDFPPDRYDGGHLLVVTGGDASYVYLADSSYYNRHVLTRAQFMQWWAGFAAVVTPR